MTAEEAIMAVQSGIDVFLRENARHPIDILGFGEMGIANSTSASAIIRAITGISPTAATGRGTGVDNKGLENKAEIKDRHQTD
jgi:nicotinate-nucleotide--dimethylbenzimidazole phosphoribosyltransferase